MIKYKIIILLFTTIPLFNGCEDIRHQEEKPNVIIFLSDDQGWGDFSIHGNSNLNTPNIDKLARDGASFENFYVQPVCSPTRAELLTGRYHSRGGVYSTSAGGERLNLDETTLPEIFKETGYTTAAYGKWHNGMQPPYHPNSRGFDDFYGFCSGHWGNYFSPMLEHNGELVEGDGFLVDDLTNHGLDFIDANKDKPFFLYLPFNTPHSPMQVPDKWWNKFENKELVKKSVTKGEENFDFTRAALAMCENIDWNVGRVLDKLEELNISENTIVVYFNDNGPNSSRWNGGMKGIKGSTNEGGVRSPLLIRWPGTIKRELQINKVSSTIDILPTLVELAGVEFNIKKTLDGKSLRPLIFGKMNEWDDRFIFNKWRESISVRNQKYRLDNDGKIFDIENDRGQLKDLSLELPDIQESMLKARKDFIDEVVADLPTDDLRPFTLGDPSSRYTQLPARDGIGDGAIKRSNRFPNCTFFTNWINLEDKITWNVEVLEESDFEVTLYYTCIKGNEGSLIQLSYSDHKIQKRITEPFNPLLRGMENDRVERKESYVKEFRPLKLGVIHLTEGPGELILKALEKPGNAIIDVRLLQFEKK